jgi:nucleoside 2-deoxyribosyltransferase
MGEEVMIRPLVYIASPFRADTPYEIERNVRRAEDHGLWVAKLGGIPVIPHTMYRFFQNSLPDTFWLEAGLTLLRTCDAVAVAVEPDQTQSGSGTVGEIGEAHQIGLPVFRPTAALGMWIETWIKERT